MAEVSPQVWQAVWLSLKVASVATVCALPVAVLVAYLLTRVVFWGRGLLTVVVYLPLVLPPVVTGYALLLMFGSNGYVGSLLADLGIVFAFRWTGAVLAAAIMGFPLMVRAIQQVLDASDKGLEAAAASLGASKIICFLTITLPLIAPGILAGAILGFAKALGEFGATITFVASIPGQTQTIPSAIYNFLQIPNGESVVMWLAGISVLLSVVALTAGELLGRWMRKRGL
ncbi:molybdate ABC transporter permease subunit [Nereida sp. NH-UV-3]|uniref:molybdate ABC transporter permease subunit n=1 Tax=Nereida TaxID=282198 RepID=UPI0036F3A2C6